MVEWREVD